MRVDCLPQTLDKAFKYRMIRKAIVDRIIRYLKSPVHHIKGKGGSYGHEVSDAIQKVRSYGSASLTSLRLMSAIMGHSLLLRQNQSNILDFSDEDLAAEEEKSDEEFGVIYARVSGHKQAKEGKSIDTQGKDGRKIADKKGITLLFDEPIVDDGKTGRNFNRPGIREVVRLALNGKISYLIVEDVKRIGRSVPQTLDYIHFLQSECDVTVITGGRELDLTQVSDLIDTTMRALMADLEVKGRGTKALKNKINRFKSDKKWTTWYQTIPLGYDETESGWIRPNNGEALIIRDMYDKFIKFKKYNETAEYINRKYKDRIENPKTGNEIKHCLKNLSISVNQRCM